MSRATVLSLALAAASFGLSWTSPVSAQGPREGTYRPANPSFSPYLDLLRRDRGQVLPSYQQFVRPGMEQRRFDRQQEAGLRLLDRDLRQVQRAQEAVQIPTGVGAGFRVGAQYFRNSPLYFQTHRERR